MSDIKVSVICTAYNHEKYIREALEGVVNQKTDFNFEVFVHDDASTDRTADVIREYEEKFPQIIKPIYQMENQHSKGIKISRNIIFPKTKGKYIAFCEGDDFWCDENKLQKQYDFMESNPRCSMVSHQTYNISEFGEIIGTYGNGKCGVYTIDDILDDKAPAFHTSSRFLKREVYEAMSGIFLNCTIGDLPSKINAALQGDIYYINEPMSKYRVLVKGSWSSRILKDLEYLNKNKNSIINFYNNLKIFTDGKYNDKIDKCIDSTIFNYSYIGESYKEAKNTSKYKSCGLKKRLIINIGIYFPWVLKSIKKVLKK